MKPETSIHALEIFLYAFDPSACDTNYACELASIKLRYYYPSMRNHRESKIKDAILKQDFEKERLRAE